MFDDTNDYWAGEGRHMDAPINRTLVDLQRGKSLTEFVSIDECRSPSSQIATATEWSLVVRGWGMVVITADGVRLLRRSELSSQTVESFGPAWK